MAIYTPSPGLTPGEKRILRILAEALLNTPQGHHASNLPSEAVPLSDADANELLYLLEEYVASRRFRERTEFVEILGDGQSSSRAREVYLRGRSEAGKTRVAASWQWSDFRLRLGLHAEALRGAATSYMDFAHFLRMEERLLEELRLHPRVRSLVIQMVVDHRSQIEAVRNGRKRIRRGSVRDIPQPIIDELKAPNQDRDFMLPLRKVVALTALTADLSVMFTTRDWGVAGTLSAIAAAAPPLLT
jgi:hypothetical protein